MCVSLATTRFALQGCVTKFSSPSCLMKQDLIRASQPNKTAVFNPVYFIAAVANLEMKENLKYGEILKKFANCSRARIMQLYLKTT